MEAVMFLFLAFILLGLSIFAIMNGFDNKRLMKLAKENNDMLRALLKKQGILITKEK